MQVAPLHLTENVQRNCDCKGVFSHVALPVFVVVCGQVVGI